MSISSRVEKLKEYKEIKDKRIRTGIYVREDVWNRFKHWCEAAGGLSPSAVVDQLLEEFLEKCE